MNDKELLIKLIGQQVGQICKMVFPSVPQAAVQTLAIMGIKNKLSHYNQYVDFFFNETGNLSSPEEFWNVAESALNDKPIKMNIFGDTLVINGKDVEEIRGNFNTQKLI